MMYQPGVTPFGGWVKNRDGVLEPVETAAHIGAYAMSGVGKTRRWLAQSAVLWPGPGLVSSSKDDIWQLVSSLRYHQQHCYLVDLRPVISMFNDPRVTQVRYDPTMLIETFDDAKYLARTMLGVSGVSLKGGYKASSDTGGWNDLAEAPLTCLLWAASPQCTNEGIEWALSASANKEVPVRESKGQLVPAFTRDGRSWAAASMWAAEAIYTAWTQDVLHMDRKMRDSVAFSVTRALKPWMATNRRDTGLDYLRTDWLAAPGTPTVYLLATTDGSTAGQAITLIDHLINIQREKTARGEDRARLGLFLDEIANTPLPNLPGYLTESRGLGCNICYAAHSGSQLDAVYGHYQGQAIRDVTPAALLLKGARELDILDAAAEWGGDATRSVNSYSGDGTDRSLQRHYGNAIEREGLMPRSLDEGRLIVRGSPGTMVELMEWDQFVTYLRKDRARRTA